MATALPQMQCPEVILPTSADFMNLMGGLAAIPGELARQAILQGQQELLETAEEIHGIVDGIKEVTGIFPLSFVPDGTVKIPEWEMQAWAQSMLNEFKLFPQVKIAELFAKIVPISLEVPVPPFDIKIDVIKLFQDPAYKGELLAKVTAEFEDLKKLLPSSIQDMWSEMGVKHDEMGIRKMFMFIIGELSAAMSNLLFFAVEKAISIFSIIWDALGLPNPAALLTIDWNALIQAQIDKAKSAGEDFLKELKEGLLGVEIFGFTIEDIMGGAIQESVQSTVREIDRMIDNLMKFAREWPYYLFEQAMAKILSFLKAIGLDGIVPYLPFTFCDFLTVLGVPKTIALPSNPAAKIVTGVASAGLAGATLGTIDKTVNNITTTAGQTIIEPPLGSQYVDGSVTVVDQSDLATATEASPLTAFTAFSIESGNIVLDSAAAEGDKFIAIPT